ncbi:MAG: MBL fold metallo-hydrolase [Actinobacteria bacterium]|nr:MBL fold metallo-hydrolase [Actinomycetota bacterium]
MKLKITFLVDNTVYLKDLKAEHGLSVLIESPEEKILFDCGQSGLLLNNAKSLNIALQDISKIVLSHGHYDHSGGLLSILKHNSRKIDVYAHPDIFKKRYELINNNADSKRYIGIPESRKTYEEYGANFNLPIASRPVQCAGTIKPISYFFNSDITRSVYFSALKLR